VGDRYVPAVANGRFYECTAAGTSAGSPPTFHTDRTSFADGTATFLDMGNVAGYDESGIAFTITQGGIPIDPATAQVDLVTSPETEANGLFTISEDLQAATIESLVGAGITLEAADLFDLSLLAEVYAENPDLIDYQA
jgi:hypothetical protein